jgi:2',3'-cyclic-nucleotide 2'-phosphodiesterase (5'-nucleotidase family)
MGLALSAVGNHEFDHGAAELLRLQRSGCATEGGCRGPRPFQGAAFQYLAASTVDATTGLRVTSAESFGRMLSAIDLKLDPATRDVIEVRAENHVVAPSFAKDPRQTALIEAYERLAADDAPRILRRD